jgi:hypothetical protein
MGERHVVPLGEPPAEGLATFRAVVSVDRDVELFESARAIVDDITPEALAGCREIQLGVRSKDLDVRVSLRFAPSSNAGVELRVKGTSAAHCDDVAAVAGTIAIAIQRGYRPYVGTVERSEGLRPGHVGRPSPWAAWLAWITPFALGAATGLAFAWGLKVFFPHTHIPLDVKGVITVALGVAYPLWLNYAIPKVELTSGGRTRLRRAVSRAFLGLATLILTTAVKVLIGAG